MSLLTEPYYSNCHEVFRRSTNQSLLLLEELKVRSAIPSEFAPGRGILELNAAQSPSEFLGSLQRSVSDRMDLVPLSVEADEMRLRVELHDPQPMDERLEEGQPSDTLSPNRY